MEKFKHFIKYHPAVTINILTLILLFISPRLAVVTLILSFLAWVYRREQNKKERLKALRAEATHYITNVKLFKKLPTVKTTVFLEDGESGFLEEPAHLSETRAVRQSHGGTAGFRVAKGVYLGGYSGRSESHREWRKLDQGKLILTSKKIIYNGGKENRTLLLKDLVSVNVLSYGIELASQKRTKSSLFAVQNPYIWGAAINIIKGVKDPLHLETVNLDVQFQ